MLDITTLAAWGEFIGGIAVVVSLIYLAGQIRQNSRLLRASSSNPPQPSGSAGFAIATATVQNVTRRIGAASLDDRIAEPSVSFRQS